MSVRVLDDFTAAWQPDGSGLWTVGVSQSAARYGADGTGLQIRATAGGPAAAPFAERRFTPPLDLRDSEELRFWLRSSRPGDGRAVGSLYLAFEATTDPPTAGAPWRRLLPVARAHVWELQRLWIGDMPAALRQAVGVLRLRSLDGGAAFELALDDLPAGTPEPVADAEAALLARLDNVHRVRVAGTPQAVRAIVDVPGSPGMRTAPYILLTPWSIVSLGLRSGTAEVVDNVTAAGAHVRPAPIALQLEYRVTAVVQDSAQRSALLERIVVDLSRPLLVGGQAVQLEPFAAPDPDLESPPGRMPLFYRVVVPAETAPRTFHDGAQPQVLVGHRGQPRAEHEVVPV